MSGRKIATYFNPTPMPVRFFDWSATFDGYDGSDGSREPIGRGATEQEAIDDLTQQETDVWV